MIPKTLYLIDGENIAIRFSEMVKAGSKAKSNTVYKEDVSFLWHPDLSRFTDMIFVRIGYYTTCVGDENKLDSLKKLISGTTYSHFIDHKKYQGTLVPHVYKKQQNSQKTKSVDINLTIDALRHTYNKSIEHLVVLSGDGDFVPLFQEVMRQGVKVTVGAFSRGLNPALLHATDSFLDLDTKFFE